MNQDQPNAADDGAHLDLAEVDGELRRPAVPENPEAREPFDEDDVQGLVDGDLEKGLRTEGPEGRGDAFRMQAAEARRLMCWEQVCANDRSAVVELHLARRRVFHAKGSVAIWADIRRVDVLLSDENEPYEPEPEEKRAEERLEQAERQLADLVNRLIHEYPDLQRFDPSAINPKHEPIIRFREKLLEIMQPLFSERPELEKEARDRIYASPLGDQLDDLEVPGDIYMMDVDSSEW